MQRVLLIMTSTALLFLGLATCGPQLKRPEISRALLESEKERQKEFSLNLFMQRYEQLIRVGTALQIKGVELCGESVEPVVGALLLERKAFPDDLQETASRVFGLNQGLHVRYVVPGLPAATAGLKQGDEVTMIGDTSLGSPAESTNESKFDKAKTLLKQYGTTPVKLEVRRDGKSLPLTMTPNLGCRFPISLVQNDNVNAFADGEKVGITTGMVRFVADDDELAIVLSHELAHNALGHVNKQIGNQLIGGILGLILDIGIAAAGVNSQGVFTRLGTQTGAAVYSQDFESEADYLGLYFAARAGFDILKAPDFFRRMGAEHPASKKETFLASHPSFPERSAGYQKYISEIQEKIKAELPLLPAKIERQETTQTDETGINVSD